MSLLGFFMTDKKKEIKKDKKEKDKKEDNKKKDVCEFC